MISPSSNTPPNRAFSNAKAWTSKSATALGLGVAVMIVICWWAQGPGGGNQMVDFAALQTRKRAPDSGLSE